jgi:hypothetical protein
VNGKKAKALRRIARGLKLPEENSYEPMGELRHKEAHRDHGRSYTAGLVRRPFALKACERRAYKEAKGLYKTPGVGLELEPVPIDPQMVKQLDEMEALHEQQSFKQQLRASLEKQPTGPVLK